MYPKLPKLIYMCYCQDPAGHADETFLGSGAMGAEPSQCINEALRDCWWQVVLSTRARCGSLGSSSHGRLCRNLCQLSQRAMASTPQKAMPLWALHAPWMTQLPRESSRVSLLTLRCQLQGVLKGSEHKQCSPLSFLLQRMMREETGGDSRSIPDFQPRATGSI